LCERQGSGRPNAWLDRVRIAAEQDDASAALDGARQALALFPQHAPIHARIAAQTAPIAERLGEHETLRELRTAAFLAEPDAAHLAWLYDALPGDADARQRHLRWAAETLTQHRLADRRPAPRCGDIALDEPIASIAVSRAAVALTELFAGDWASARQRADASDTLGWSSPDNAQPLVVAYALLALCGGDPRRLGPNTAQLWDSVRPTLVGLAALRHVDDDDTPAEVAATERLDAAAQCACAEAPLPADEAEEWLGWCTRTVWHRTRRIVENKHRRAYARAATAVAACTEAAHASGMPGVVDPMIGQLRSRFSRHSAFQRELKTALAQVPANA